MHFLKTIMPTFALLTLGSACTNGTDAPEVLDNEAKKSAEELPLPFDTEKEVGQSTMHLYSEVEGEIFRPVGKFGIWFDRNGNGEPDTEFKPGSFTALPDSPARHSVELPPTNPDDPTAGFWVIPEGVTCLLGGEPIPCKYAGSDPEPFRVVSGGTTMVDLFFQIGDDDVHVLCSGTATFRIIAGAACNHHNDCDGAQICAFPEGANNGVCAESKS